MSTKPPHVLRQAVVATSLGLVGLAGAALPSGASATPRVATPARHATKMTSITVKGRVLRVTSKDSFTVRSGMHHYVVVLNHMTHVTVGHRRETIHQIHAGDTVTVKGPLEMGRLHASSVVVTGM